MATSNRPRRSAAAPAAGAAAMKLLVPSERTREGAPLLFLSRLPTILVPALIAAAVAAHAIASPGAASDLITLPAPHPPAEGPGPSASRQSGQTRPPAASSIAAPGAATGAAAPAFAAAALSARDLATLEAAGPGTLSAVAAYLDRTDRQLLSAEAGAITLPDRAELLLVGSGRGCAACRPRWIAVWDLAFQAPLWTTPDGDGSGTVAAIAGDGTGTVAAIAGDGTGFTRTDAVWRPGDARCCPSDAVTRLLEWDGATSTFVERPAITPEQPRPIRDQESAADQLP